ncbi:CE290 protein, partial [Atractosteus spatula]|nr:CE290 protein [Atractosteus spatula]
LRRKTVDAYESGKGFKAISKQIVVNHFTVQMIIYKWIQFQTTGNLSRPGCPTKFNTTADRKMLQEVSKNPRITSRDLQASLASVKVKVIMCGEKAAKQLDLLPPPKDTVTHRIIEMADYIKSTLIERIKMSRFFSLQVEKRDLKGDSPEKIIHLFRITQAIMKMKAQEVDLALEEVEKAGEEQAKIENQLKAKVYKLEHELEMAQRTAGGRDTRFLRDEIRQLENQLDRKEKELAQVEKEINKEKKANEELTLRAEEAENENRKLKREIKHLKKKHVGLFFLGNGYFNWTLMDFLRVEAERDELKAQNDNAQKALLDATKEMMVMEEDYSRMKITVKQSDILMDQMKKESEHLKLQVQELTAQIQAKAEEDDPVMAAVNLKVEEWKRILSAKDDEIMEYQQMLRELKEKLRVAQLDSDKNNIMALQQAVQERDSQIKMLTEQVEQYTSEMETNAIVIEELKKPLQKTRGLPTVIQQKKTEELQAKLQVAEQRVRDAERVAELAESDAKEKDKELSDALSRMTAYEAGVYGLENAVAEIKEYKKQIKTREQEMEYLTREINKQEMKINDLLDENEDFRERLGLNPKEVVDLSEFRQTKALKQQQYRAENQILHKEIERLEEERLNLKRHIRKLVKDKGLSGDYLQLEDDFSRTSISFEKAKFTSSSINQEEMRDKLLIALNVFLQNEHLLKELNDKDKELQLRMKESAEFKAKFDELLKEKKYLEEGMKEILQVIKDAREKSQGDLVLHISSLERLISIIEVRNSPGGFDACVHLRTQVDQLTGKNEELRKEMKEARKEAANASSQLMKANEKVERLECEMEALKQSRGSSVVFKTLNLPEEMASSSMEELKNKEATEKVLEEALEEYKRKFAVVRHQQGLLYKEYQSERESWLSEKEKFTELKNRLEEQKELDAVKIKEYNHWLEVLEMDPSGTKKQVSEAARKITVLRVNEKSLTRRYTTLLEMEQHLRKENNRLKNEILEMNSAVADRIGYLQRYKLMLKCSYFLHHLQDMAAFKIAALQKALDNSVSSSELERANKQYNELTIKYRDTLQRDNQLVWKTTNLEHLEGENLSLLEKIDGLNRELEITKEKLHTLEQAWEQVTKLGGEGTMDKATKAITNSEILSISKKITMLEMKELNERQRAEHAHKMYEHLRTSFKRVEDRNFELETKFAELTKQNLEAQKIEQELRDELSNSVSKAVSDADRRRIMELEKTEAELKMEVSKLRDISEVAKMQVSALEARQQSREKEVEALRRQVLDYQAQSDEKALIAKLHQHIVALQMSEATAVSKLEAALVKVQKLEAYSLRMEQKLDDKEQALYYARLEGRNRAKHLRQTIQSLRRHFSGALPLAQQEKFSKTMIQLQNDKLKILQDVQRTEQERRKTEEKALELEIKMKGLEELISTLKDVKGAQKVTEWHKKMEELRLQDLKHSREFGFQKEEIKYLKNVIAGQERTISSLEEEVIQQKNLHEERQLSWDQREVELERQLDLYERQQNEVLSTARKFEEATGNIPDPSLPLPQQLDFALRKIKEHLRTILETQSTCKILEEKLKEKEAALWKAEQNVLSRDKVINELRLRLPATAEREKLIAELGKREEDPEYQQALKVAHQTIANLQARLNQKEDIVKKYQNLLARARQEQEDMTKKHEEQIRVLHQKLDLHSDTSLNKFKQTALELMKKPNIAVPTTKHLIRLAEMEQTVAEQDNSLSSLTEKLKRVTADLEKQKQITSMKMKEHENEKAKLEGKYATQSKKLREEADELREQLSQMEKEVQYLKTELEAQKEANVKSPTATMKNLVERLKSQLMLKEKQQKALSKALLELRSEMTAHAEQQIIASAAQKEQNLNVQQIVDKHTKDLKAINKADGEGKCATVDELQKKVKRVESELESKNTAPPVERKPMKEDKTTKEEIIRWEESKKWQAKLESVRNKLKEKEKEADTLTKQLSTLKDLYARTDQEKAALQKKLKSRGVTVDQVVGARTLESEKVIEELKRRNSDLEHQIVLINISKCFTVGVKNSSNNIKLQILHSSSNMITSPKETQYKEYAVKNESSVKEHSINESENLFPQEAKSISDIEEKNQSDTHFYETYLEDRAGLNKDKLDERDPGIAENPMTEEQTDVEGSNLDILRSPDECESARDRDKEGKRNTADCDHPVSEKTDSKHSESVTNEEGELCAKQRENGSTEENNGNDLNEVKEDSAKKKSVLSLKCGQELEPSCETGEDVHEEEPQIVENEAYISDKEMETLPESEYIEDPELKHSEVHETSGRGSDTPSQAEHELQRQNLKLSSENLELRFQLEQARKDLPRLNDQVADLKEMCDIVKKEKTELERKLGNVRGSGRSGKTVPELEKTIGLMKKVVERVQRENEALKKAPGIVSREQLTALENENEKLKSDYEKLKLQVGGQLSMRYESKTKGMEKIIAENERLRKDLKKEAEAAEKLRITKNNLELTNEKLRVQLEETNQRLSIAESRGPQLEGADSKSWKSIVVTRMYESKMKELESDIARKNSSITDVKQLLKEAVEREQKTRLVINDLKEQIEILKHFPEDAKTESGLAKELQLVRLTNSRLEKEKAELVHQLAIYRQQRGAEADSTTEPGFDELLEKAMKHDKLMEELVELQTQLKAADLDKRHMQEEVKKMKKELENFDPTFFEEIEDLKFNYNVEVKRNILLEEQLKKLSQQFGVEVDIPTNVSVD